MVQSPLSYCKNEVVNAGVILHTNNISYYYGPLPFKNDNTGIERGKFLCPKVPNRYTFHI